MDFLAPPKIAGQVIQKKKESIEIWPITNNYASEVGHPCERYLYYQRTSWHMKEPHDVTLQFIFDGGNMIEEMALQELREAGFRVLQQQTRFVWDDYRISGKIDARIPVGDTLPPLEVKCLNHREWSGLESVEDMFASQAPWVRRYPGQLLCYMWMSNEPRGLFYLKSKSTFEPKDIWIDIEDHIDYMEKSLEKIERVNRAVLVEEIPERMEIDDRICPDCGYFTLCQPDVELVKGAALLVDADLEEALDLRGQLKQSFKDYGEADKYVKRRLKGVERAVIGQWLITGKRVERAGYAVKASEYWRTNINRITNRE